MSAWSTIGLAIALSLDGFGAGVAYGIKRIRLPFSSLLIICLCSAVSMGVALLAGKGLTTLINGDLAGKLGGGILVLLGLFQIYNTVSSARPKKPKVMSGASIEGKEVNMQAEHQQSSSLQVEAEHILSITLRPFGLVIQILKEPTRADLDASGEIGPHEALLLGLALSMDAFGAGLGASLVGPLPLYTPLVVGLTQLGFVTAGLCWGHSHARWAGGIWISYVAGFVLLSLGVGKII